MGIFDSIKDKAEDLAGDAERAGKVGAAQVKLRSLKGDVSEAMEALGREVFGLVEKGELTHAGLDAVVAKAREAKKAVAEKQAEIERLKAED